MEVSADDLEESMRQADEQLEVLAWKLDSEEKDMDVEENPELVVGRLLQSVTEVRNDYQNLRRELVEVQALQRELSGRLRQQLQQVQGKFSTLKERIAGAPPH